MHRIFQAAPTGIGSKHNADDIIIYHTCVTVPCARTYAIAELVISMMLFQSLISPWIHGGDPVNALHINKLLLKFKVSTILLFLHTYSEV